MSNPLEKDFPEVLETLPFFIKRYRQFQEPAVRIGPQPITSNKVGRNEPCPCGSGKKFKKCCG